MATRSHDQPLTTDAPAPPVIAPKRGASSGAKSGGVITILIVFSVTAFVCGVFSYVLARLMFPWSGLYGKAIAPSGQPLGVEAVTEAASRLVGLLAGLTFFSPALPLAVRALVQPSQTVRRTVLVTIAGTVVMLVAGIAVLSIAEAQVPGAKSFWQLTYGLLILPLLALSGGLAAGSFSGGGWRVAFGTWGGLLLAGAAFWPFQTYVLGKGTEWEGPIWRGILWLATVCVGAALGSCVAAAALMAARPVRSRESGI